MQSTWSGNGKIAKLFLLDDGSNLRTSKHQRFGCKPMM